MRSVTLLVEWCNQENVNYYPLNRLLHAQLMVRIPILIPTAFVLLTTIGFANDDVQFNRDVRAILSENCFHCHGPDDAAREADLRLDDEASAKESAIEPGDADASELIIRITSDDPDVLMPPPESERSLSEEQIAILRRWIDDGATYEGHWAFNPPVRGAPPESDNGSLGVIDRYIQRQLGLRDSALCAARGSRDFHPAGHF